MLLTHFHSDHTVGYPDLIFTPWVMGRHAPLEVYGPRGIGVMTDHILKAWQIDINARTNGLNQHNRTGCQVGTHEIESGMVYRDRLLTVTAFPAYHEEMVDSFSYRFDTPDRTIVISGDTTQIDRDYVATMAERRVSPGRTALLALAVGAAVYAAASSGLLGGGKDNSDEPTGPINQNNRGLPRPHFSRDLQLRLWRIVVP